MTDRNKTKEHKMYAPANEKRRMKMQLADNPITKWLNLRHIKENWHHILLNRLILLNLQYKAHQIPKLKCFSYRIAVVLAQSIEARYQVENEDVVGAVQTGDAPTTSERATILLPLLTWTYIRGLRAPLPIWTSKPLRVVWDLLLPGDAIVIMVNSGPTVCYVTTPHDCGRLTFLSRLLYEILINMHKCIFLGKSSCMTNIFLIFVQGPIS